jgi:hypothetical protein
VSERVAAISDLRMAMLREPPGGPEVALPNAEPA